DTSLVDKCYELANHWEKRNVSGSWDGFKPSEHDIDGWISGQKVAFLERIQDWEKTMKPELVHELNEVYKFDKSENAEIVSRYLNIGLRAEDKEVYDLTAYWLGKWGRMKVRTNSHPLGGANLQGKFGYCTVSNALPLVCETVVSVAQQV